MDKKEIFSAILEGKINSKNYEKHGLSKAMFYKLLARVKFYRKIVDPIGLMILNLSSREFLAVQNSKLKSEIPSKSKSKSFPQPIQNNSHDAGETSKGYRKKASSEEYENEKI